MCYVSQKNPIKVYRVLSCVLYYIIKNYVCIDYLCCQSKTLRSIYYDKKFEQASYNILLGIDITVVIINLVSCYGFMEEPNSTVILNFQSCLVNYYLEKCFVIIKHNSKQLHSVPNDVKLRIHAINQQKTDFGMAKTTETYSLAITVNKLCTQSDLHLVYKKKLYHDKEK